MTTNAVLSPVLPWVTPEVAGWLLSVLRGDWNVLETGAGGSTVFFAQHCREVTTYEHDPEWAHQIAGRLSGYQLENVHLLFRPNYPAAGLEIIGATRFDLAFIDGRGRVRSVIDVLPHIKRGGWLVLDDSDRERYAEARRVADEAASCRIVFRSGQDETTAWRIR